VKRIAWLLAVGLVSAAWLAQPATAQNPQPAATQSAAPAATPPPAEKPAVPALPTAREIFEHYAQAIGGRETWQKLNTRVSRGTVRIEGVDGTNTILVYERAPNQSLSLIKMANGATIRDGFDGKEGWEQNLAGAVKAVDGARSADIRAESDFYFEVNLARIFPHARTMGQRTADGRLAYVVEASAPGGSLHWYYFDAETWLRFRTDVFANPLSPTPTTIERFDDFKDVDGIKVPFKVSAKGSGNSIDIRFTVVRHNVGIAEDEIARPASASN